MNHINAVPYAPISRDQMEIFDATEKPIGVAYKPFGVSWIAVDSAEGGARNNEYPGIYDYLCNVSQLGDNQSWYVEVLHIVVHLGQKPLLVKKWECNC
jgi:hypothetical protein